MAVSKALIAHQTRSSWAYRTPSVLYAPAVGCSCTVSSRALIFSEGRLCFRHVFGRKGGRGAETAFPGAVLCATAESAHASIMRTLKCKNRQLANRARSVLAANISTGLQGSVTPPSTKLRGNEAQRVTMLRHTGNLQSSVCESDAAGP